MNATGRLLQLVKGAPMSASNILLLGIHFKIYTQTTSYQYSTSSKDLLQHHQRISYSWKISAHWVGISGWSPFPWQLPPKEHRYTTLLQILNIKLNIAIV